MRRLELHICNMHQFPAGGWPCSARPLMGMWYGSAAGGLGPKEVFARGPQLCREQRKPPCSAELSNAQALCALDGLLLLGG